MTPDNLSPLVNDNDRVLIAACVLPNDGVLSQDQRARALSNFRDYCQRVGVTPSQAAHQLGSINRATILRLLKGIFPKEADDHVRTINFWVEQDARRRAAKLSERFVETKVALDILNCARIARENRTMALCVGPTGIGKTRCAQAARERFVGTIYLRVITGYNGAKGIVHALTGELLLQGLSVKNRRFVDYRRRQLEWVIRTLKDSGRLIIIDEAHALHDGALEVLRDIHDSAGVPMLLLSTRDLSDRIVKNADPDHGQQYSRFDIILHLTEGCNVHSGGRPLFTVSQIRELYADQKISLSTDAQRYLQDVSNTLGYGSLRRCEILVRNAARLARRRAGVGEFDSITVIASDLEWVETNLRHEAGEHSLILERRRRSLAASG